MSAGNWVLDALSVGIVVAVMMVATVIELVRLVRRRRGGWGR